MSGRAGSSVSPGTLPTFWALAGCVEGGPNSGHSAATKCGLRAPVVPKVTDPLKRWKLSYEDFRNHTHWKGYEAAIEDMVEVTSTKHAPWYLVPANNKPFGRLATFRIIADRLSQDAALEPRALDPKVMEAARQLLGITLPSGNYREP
jgi:hypothetical protein